MQNVTFGMSRKLRAYSSAIGILDTPKGYGDVIILGELIIFVTL